MSIKNLPADYLLAAQQVDIDKVKTGDAANLLI